MNSSAQQTRLLIALACIAMVAAVVGCITLNRAHAFAVDRQADLDRVQNDLSEMARWHTGPLASAPRSADDPELSRRLRAAATAAGVSDQLASVEPGQPARVPNADYLQTPVFIRLNAATLRQVIVMLSALADSDAAVRIHQIELSPAAAAPPSAAATEASTAEQWTADLTLEYLAYSPRTRPGS